MSGLVKIVVLLVPLLWLGAWGSIAQAAICTSNAGAINWNTAANWSCGHVPVAADSVIIPNGSTVTLNVSQVVASLQIDSGGALTVAAGTNFDIYLGGNLINNGTINFIASTGANNIYLAGANVTSTFSGSGTWLLDAIDLNGGAVAPCTGTCKIELSGSPNLQLFNATPIAGASVTNTFNALGNSTATVTLIRAGNQAVTTRGVTYPNLVLAGSGNKAPSNLATFNILGNLTLSSTAASTTSNTTIVGGNLDVGSGTTFNVAGFDITVAGATSVSGTLTHSNAAGTKAYTGNVTINNGGNWNETAAAAISFAGNLQNDGALTASTGVHTFSGAAKTLSGANAIVIPSVTVSGTYQNDGTLTVATALAVSGSLTNNGTVTATTALTGAGTLINGIGTAATLNIGVTAANLTLTTLTATAATNTVNYNRAGAQTVKVTAYHDLTLSTSGVKTMTGVTTIGGNLAISGTATMTGNAAFTVAGTLNYTSTGATTLTAATPISIGTFNQTAGTLIDNGNTITVTGTGAGTWTRAASTFTATGTVIFNGAAPQIGASNFNNLTINVGAGNAATLTGNATPAGNLTVSTGTLDLATFTANRAVNGSMLTVANGARLRIGGVNTFPTNYNTHTLGATSTVEYSGTNQSVAAETAPGYGNLTLSGSGTKTATGGFTVRGDLAITGVILASAATVQTVNGNVNNTGTQTATTGSITLSGGTAAHVLSGTGTYANLVMNDAFGATLSASPLVSGVLTLTNGIITTGANVPEVTSSCAAGITRTGGYVYGNLSLHYPTSAATTTCTFPIGDATAYTPATIAIANVSSSLANSILTARTDAGDHADTPGCASSVDPNKSVNRYWTLTPGGSLNFTTYNATFTFVNGDIDGGANTANFIIARKSGGAWTRPSMGAKNPNDTAATGITQAVGFGVFTIGEVAMPSITVVKSFTVVYDPVNLYGPPPPKAIPGAVVQYTIQVINSGCRAVDNNSIGVTDAVPANMTMYVVDDGSSGVPVTFTCSIGPPSCGLGWDYANDVKYSATGTAPYDYTPTQPYDPNVKGVQISPSGVMNGSLGTPRQFTLQLRMRIN